MRNFICFSIFVFVLLFECSLYGEPVEFEEAGYSAGDIFFRVNSVELDGQAKNILQEKADFLKKNPEKNIIIEGHCDERGSEAFNYDLGLKRANSAAEFFLHQGISLRRIEVISHGEKQPISSLAGEKGWRLNRRVTIEIR